MYLYYQQGSNKNVYKSQESVLLGTNKHLLILLM